MLESLGAADIERDLLFELGDAKRGSLDAVQPEANSSFAGSDIDAWRRARALDYQRGSTAASSSRPWDQSWYRIWNALPKDKFGNVGHSMARYALHRIFMKRFSWFVRGLEPGAERAPHKESTATLRTNFSSVRSDPTWPSFLQGKLENFRGGGGLSKHDVEALINALEDVVHHETTNRLTMAYDGHGVNIKSQLTDEVINDVMKDFTVLFMSSWAMPEMTREVLMKKESVRFSSSNWKNKVYPWLHGLLESGLPADVIERSFSDVNTSFPALAHVGDEIGRRFHELNDPDCQDLKNTFLSFESRVPGRVRLSDFYNKSRYSTWGFTEKIEYLRDLGALDETNASNPLVAIPNYITSMPQCVPASSVYSVCCPNECEQIMYSLEGRFASPTAKPHELVAHIEGGIIDNTVVASESFASPRKVSRALRHRLNAIAGAHGGDVPLHGRLFAEWLHHAFPRECPYPHKASAPLTPDEWIQASGHENSQASEEEMLAHIRPDDSCPVSGCGGSRVSLLVLDDIEDEDQTGLPPWTPIATVPPLFSRRARQFVSLPNFEVAAEVSEGASKKMVAEAEASVEELVLQAHDLGLGADDRPGGGRSRIMTVIALICSVGVAFAAIALRAYCRKALGAKKHTMSYDCVGKIV
eukprot:TRINITY_DN4206_c0_g1_i5.p1 TRINITY_DN4206_c0_g1~~TRINITY_DN4206_c0_g1_i5.p1  ORF type:complete len:691 (-),score=103.87 TRINITY_DN4206_c0_g1_i5:126-2054(-)